MTAKLDPPTRPMATQAFGREHAPTVHALVVLVRELEDRIARLERGAGSRDDADEALRQLLPAATRGLPFRAADLLRHGDVDPALRAALEAAIITTPYELGAWLRRMRGTRDGVAIDRLHRRRWRATYTAST